MDTPASRTDVLREHMAATYFKFRTGVGIVGAVLPWTLWLGGRVFDGESLRASMSAYYYSDAMGDTFVGVLVAVGLFLYLYKGFSSAENWALNLAGAFAIGVALVPTTPPGETSGAVVTPHGTFAVLLFLSIAYVSIFRASDTLSLIRDPRIASAYRAGYRLLGFGMIVSPLIAFFLEVLSQPDGNGRTLIFFVEALAVTMFAAYWLVKSREMRQTNAERLALEGKLKIASRGGEAVKALGRVVQIAPLEETTGGWGHTAPEDYDT